nr:PEPxxWA-CTERM sorting domain-containing protein [Polymorphobacter sp.]
MLSSYWRFGVALAAAFAVAAPAAAVITSGAITGGTVFTRGGSFILIGNPSGLSVGLNNFDDNNVRAFNELQNYTLGPALLADVGGSIAGGSLIDSHYLVFDSRRNQTVEGSASFRTRVLGILYNDSRLLGSDFLGAPGVSYLNPGGRGLEPPVDVISFTGNTVSFSLSGSNPGDTFRVITAGYVPEPSTWAMLVLGFGLVGTGLRRVRRVGVQA